MANPYQSAERVPPPLAVGREELVALLVQRLLTRHATILSGDVRSGKSTVLLATATQLRAQGWRVSLVEGTRLERRLTRAQFWEDALLPLRDLPDHPSTAGAYRQARAYEFSPETLASLIGVVREEGLQVALLIDDLEAILRHPGLNGALMGELAGLVGHHRLAFLGAGAVPLSGLQARLERQAPPGTHTALSTWVEQALPPLSPTAVSALLARGDAVFSAADRTFLERVGGRQAYLLQLLAAPLWDQAAAGTREPLRREQAGGYALAEVERTIGAAWRAWAPDARWAMLRIALAQLDYSSAPLVLPTLADPTSQALLKTLAGLEPEELRLMFQTLNGQAIPADLPRAQVLKSLLQLLIQRRLTAQALALLATWRPDLALDLQQIAQRSLTPLPHADTLEALQLRGILRQTEAGRLQLDADVLLWWLADQLAPLARGDVDFSLWLRGQGMSVPDAHATIHLLWRLERLAPLLARGSRPLIRDAAAENGSRLASWQAGR